MKKYEKSGDPMKIEKKQQPNKKGLTILLFFTFFMVIGFEMIMPLIIGHYVNDMNFIATKVAFALAIRKFSQQGLAMIGGVLADRKDIKKIISAGMFLRTIGFTSLAYANNFLALLLSMILIGFGGVLFEAPYQTAIATLTTEQNRSRYYSLNNTIVGIASTLGPLVGAFLLRFDFKIVCFGAAICFMINFFLSMIAMPSIIRTENAIKIKESFKMIKKDKRYIKFTGLMIVFWLVASQIDISFPLRIQEISGNPESVGWMYSIYAAVTAVLQYPLVTYMLKRYSPRQIVVIGVFIISIAIVLVPFIATTEVFLAVVALFTLGMLLARPNQQTIAVTIADPKATGVYLGFNYLGFALGSGFGTIIGGAFFDLANKTGLYKLPWFLFSGIGLIALYGFINYRDKSDFPNKENIISM